MIKGLILYCNDKGLMFKVYEVHIQLNIKRRNISIKKWAETLNKHFSSDNIQITHRHMKRCPTSLIIRDLKIKKRMWYLFTPVRIVIILKRQKRQQQQKFYNEHWGAYIFSN